MGAAAAPRMASNRMVFQSVLVSKFKKLSNLSARATQAQGLQGHYHNLGTTKFIAISHLLCGLILSLGCLAFTRMGTATTASTDL